MLPGVGAFRDAIAALESRELVEPIRAAIAAGKPFLGICLGLQLLFDRSYEDGEYQGLGVMPGEVVRVRRCRTEYKVPHMGWNQVRFRRRPPIFAGIDDGAHFYFVHSYYVVPRDAVDRRHRDRLPAAVLFEHLARQSVRHAVPSGEEPGRRPAAAARTSPSWPERVAPLCRAQTCLPQHALATTRHRARDLLGAAAYAIF